MDLSSQLCLLVLFTGCLAGKLAAPKFKEVNPKYLEIPLGQKCKLRCPVSGNPQPTVEWFKVTPNGSLESVANSSIIRNHLHIHSFTEEDQGVYWCKASNPHGSVATNFTVRVAEPYLDDGPRKDADDNPLTKRQAHPLDSNKHFAPYFTGHMNELVARPAGAYAVFKCSANANPPPSISWYRDGVSMSKHLRKFDKEVTFRKFSMIMEQLDTSDNGNYTCVVSNSEGSASFSYRLDVQERFPHRPIFQDSPTNVTVKVGGRARFECKFVSDLQPKVMWLRHFAINGSYSDQYELPYVQPVQSTDANETDPYVLVIDNVGFEDEGYYTCLAANEIGISYRSGFLKVLPKEGAVAQSKKAVLMIESHLTLFIMLLVFLFLSPICLFILLRCRHSKKNVEEAQNIVLTKKIILERPGDVCGNSVPVVKIDYKMVSPLFKKDILTEYELPLDPKYEFPRQNLRLGNVLGQGAFAQVFKAEAFGLAVKQQAGEKKGSPSVTVAVKMLKELHTDADMTMLVKELELMKVISERKHKNVLNLLGCCTKGGPLYLLVELCEKGNLRDYLRAHRNHSFSGYEEPIGSKKVENLTFKTLIRYAYQVANGMRYLADLKCIHRDLAARNVLITDEDVIKIADFGLAREIFDESDYYKKKGNNGKLPVKWMAPEAISERLYSEKSDVWAYGILLYEIFTLGATPYPTIPYEKLYEQLKLGHRMAKPENCPLEVYMLMRKCWHDKPSDRPPFEEIVKCVDGIMLNSLETAYLELNLPVISTPENSSSGEDSS